MRNALLGIIVATAATAQTTVMVAMRDGVKLSTNIYLPASGTKFPVLVSRTPYTKEGVRGQAEALAKRGYAVVIQDVRGRYDSEGVFYPFVNEGPDGYDAVEWAAAQPWSTGQVGMFGMSYLAWDQYTAAMEKPPHLVALCALAGGANFYRELAYPGGVPYLIWPSWIYGSAMSSQMAKKDPSLAEPLAAVQKSGMDAWLALTPEARGEAFRRLPLHEKIYRDFITHPDFDSYWKQKGFWTAGYYERMKDVPMLFVTGWYDYFGDGVLENFAGLSKLQKTPKQLMVGPWPHFSGRAVCGDANFGSSAAVDEDQLIADWFDHVIGGKDFELKAPVRLFRMGGGDGSRGSDSSIHLGGEWRDAPSWPPPDAHPTRYYLRESGVLSATPPRGEMPSAYDHDPKNPEQSTGGRSPGCVVNQVVKTTGHSNRWPVPRVLSFATAPLEMAVEVTGVAKARLWVASSAPSTDFMVKLVDVYPNGYGVSVAEGEIRTKASPGEVHAVELPFESTSNLFGAGHRIRIDISSSNFPRFGINPLKAHNTIHHDTDRVSYVELPVY